MRLDIKDERIQELLEAFGVPYVYGAGTPKDGVSHWPLGVASSLDTTKGEVKGWDCSGFVQACLVRLNYLNVGAPDRNAAALSQAAKKISERDALLGDLAFYGTPGHISHVMLYLGGGIVYGAHGGSSQTFGLDPRAYVSLERIRYRTDLVAIGQLRA